MNKMIFLVINFTAFNLLFSQNNILSVVNNEKINTGLNEIVITNDTIEEPEVSIKNNNNSNSFYSNVINYNLPKNGFVKIKIIDYNGTEVASLVKREQTAGKHFVNFSTINLTSGIYKYKIILDEKIIANRVIIVN